MSLCDFSHSCSRLSITPYCPELGHMPIPKPVKAKGHVHYDLLKPMKTMAGITQEGVVKGGYLNKIRVLFEEWENASEIDTTKFDIGSRAKLRTCSVGSLNSLPLLTCSPGISSSLTKCICFIFQRNLGGGLPPGDWGKYSLETPATQQSRAKRKDCQRLADPRKWGQSCKSPKEQEV